METTTAETSGTAAEGAVHQPSTAAEEEGKRKMKVLVGMDESDGSFYALKWALHHLLSYPIQEPADDQDPNTVTLVHVQPIFQLFMYPAGPVVYTTPAVIDSVKKAQTENAAAVLSRALHMCKEKKIKAETSILEGDPKDKICQAAEQLHVDLVVIGSRGLSTIKRAFLGSVSNYCMHHVHCPVLVVKPPSREAPK